MMVKPRKINKMKPLDIFINTFRVRYLKLTIWRPYGNYLVFSSVRITAMEWEHLLREQRPAPITTREEILFLG
jgi:hypothetical protein